MTTITATLTAICAGGDHLTFSITGAKTMTIKSNASDMLATLTDDDVEIFVKVLTKMAKSGRTLAQAKTLLQSGVVVTV